MAYDERIFLYCSKDDKEKLYTLSKYFGISQSEIVRTMIADEFNAMRELYARQRGK